MALGDTRVPRTIASDLARRDLKNTPIKPGELACGIILFPREAGRSGPCDCNSKNRALARSPP